MPKKYCLLFAAITVMIISGCDKKTEIPENARRMNEIDSLSKIIDGYHKYDFKYSLQLTGDSIPRVIIPDSMNYFQNFKNWDNYKGSMTNIYTLFLLLKLQKYCLKKYGRDGFDLFEMFNTSENTEYFLLNYLEIAGPSTYSGHTLSEISIEAKYNIDKLTYQETKRNKRQTIWGKYKQTDYYDVSSKHDKFLFLINQEIKWMVQDINRYKRNKKLNIEIKDNENDENKYKASYIKIKDFVNNYNPKFIEFPDVQRYEENQLRTIKLKATDIKSKDILDAYLYNKDSTMRYLLLLDFKGLLKLAKYNPPHESRSTPFDSSSQRKMIEILALDYANDFKPGSGAATSHSWLIIIFNHIYGEFFSKDEEISSYDQEIYEFIELWGDYSMGEVQPEGWPPLEEFRRKADSLESQGL